MYVENFLSMTLFGLLGNVEFSRFVVGLVFMYDKCDDF